MNLDDELMGEDPYGLREQWEEQIREMQARRRRKDLPDLRRVIFECVKCGKTVGSAGEHKGRLIFKVVLTGCDHIVSIAGNIRLEPGIIKDHIVEAHDTTVGRTRVENIQYCRQAGGKCQCGVVHHFVFEEMAQALGFADCASALMPFLPEGMRVPDYNAQERAWAFINAYLHRTDGRNLSLRRDDPFGSDDPFAEE